MISRRIRPTKRAVEIGRARVAGYHGDNSTFTYILAERRCASFEALQAAYSAGYRARKGGISCGCLEHAR